MRKDWRRSRRGRGPRRPGSGKPRISFAHEATCEICGKPLSLCVCETIRKHPNEHFVIVLQHPQEPDKHLGTATLLTQALEHSQLKVALSVPSLKRLLGTQELDPKRWGVLYLGSGWKRPERAGPPSTTPEKPLPPGLYVTTKDGELLTAREQKEILSGLEGIVLLDGTWSQAKTLWWRNSWLLKLRRLILVPSRPSLYRELRKEPRAECLSTIETAAEALDALGEKPEIGEDLRKIFATLLDRYREALKAPKSAAPASTNEEE